MVIWYSIIIIVASLLIGSIPWGLIVVRITTGKDIREVGSGRTGGTNAMRAAGVMVGLFTVFLDMGKGVAAGALVDFLLPGNTWIKILAIILVILGHNYSIFLIEKDENGLLHFGGGAGGAPCLGGSIALWAPAGVIIFPLSLMVFLFVGYASITTLSIAFFSIVLFAYRAWQGLSPWEYVLYGVISLILLLIALKPNLERLKQGNEREVGFRAYLTKKRKNASNKMDTSTTVTG